MISALATICARHAAGEVRSPGGLPRRMVRLHRDGRLKLARTLIGPVKKPDDERTPIGRPSP